jgi:hypothetical protein
MTKILRRSTLAALVIGFAATPVFAQNSVTHWGQITQNAVLAGRPPGSGSVLMGIVHAAIYDAAVAIEGRFKPFAVSPLVDLPASVDAAVAAAAYNTAKGRVPAQEPALTAQYNAYIATLPSGAATTNGIRVGEHVAAAILALRAADGFDNVVPYIQPAIGPGVWEPTLPAPPIDTKLALVQPLVMETPWQFRPHGPYALDSRQYARDFAAVKRNGRVGAVRTPERNAAIPFWSDNGVAQWNAAARSLAVETELSALKTARLLAMVNVVMADSNIACFDAKYHFNFWRPVHAVRRADTDGNAATAADPAWTPTLNVNHPEYPSGHACLSGAAAEALKSFFETDQLVFSVFSAVTGTTRQYVGLEAAVRDVRDARIDAGLHFPKSMDDGAAIARRVNRFVLKRHFGLAVEKKR